MNTLSIFELLPGLTEATVTASKIKAHVSIAILEARKAMNIDQKKLAEILNVSQAMVSKWESGHYNFSIEALAKIANKLNLELDVSLSPKKEDIKSIDISKFRSNNRFTAKYSYNDYVSNETDMEELTNECA